jgi:hypothetical protein
MFKLIFFYALYQIILAVKASVFSQVRYKQAGRARRGRKEAITWDISLGIFTSHRHSGKSFSDVTV